MKKVWSANNNCLFLRDISATQDALDKKVYTIERDAQTGELYLKELFNEFKFDFKLYGLETVFISRFIKTYKNTTGNLGALLNGVKGTGKTITAEMLSNELGLPTILINANFPGLNNFLADISEDITIIIDEYEKVFRGAVSEDDYDRDPGNEDSTLLSIMDGVYKTEYRKVFILTTNHPWLNENMLNRPGRIRYVKPFTDLNLEQINEIIDDCLTLKDYKEDILDFLKPLKIITVDIVKCIVNEINIHNEKPEVCCLHFNLERKKEKYNIFEITTAGKEELLHEEVDSSYLEHLLSKRKWKGSYFTVDTGEYYHIQEKPNYNKMIFVVRNDGSDENLTIRIKKSLAEHHSFAF